MKKKDTKANQANEPDTNLLERCFNELPEEGKALFLSNIKNFVSLQNMMTEKTSSGSVKSQSQTMRVSRNRP